jgi:thiamine transport system substrate-binding protein
VGVDNTWLSAATDGDIFDGEPAQVDFGDVCVNYDIAWFAERGSTRPPRSTTCCCPSTPTCWWCRTRARRRPVWRSCWPPSPSTAPTGWQQYWQGLRDNGVEVVDSWEVAYYERFSGAAGSDGPKPLVVSYASSPPAEVLFADPPRDDAPTGVLPDTCFRQLEYAGVLRGTDHPTEAQQLLDFLQSTRFQQELPLTLFVYPADASTPLPEAFTRYSVIADNPYTVEPARHRRQP